MAWKGSGVQFPLAPRYLPLGGDKTPCLWGLRTAKGCEEPEVLHILDQSKTSLYAQPRSHHRDTKSASVPSISVLIPRAWNGT
jgi:hypothetical protein